MRAEKRSRSVDSTDLAAPKNGSSPANGRNKKLVSKKESGWAKSEQWQQIRETLLPSTKRIFCYPPLSLYLSLLLSLIHTQTHCLSLSITIKQRHTFSIFLTHSNKLFLHKHTHSLSLSLSLDILFGFLSSCS